MTSPHCSLCHAHGRETPLHHTAADAWGWTTLHAIAVVTRLVALIWFFIELWVEPDTPDWYLATRKDT